MRLQDGKGDGGIIEERVHMCTKRKSTVEDDGDDEKWLAAGVLCEETHRK